MDLNSSHFIIVGAGFFGSVIAERIANDLNENVIVIDKRNHIGGNCYSVIEKSTGIEYHKYGTHIFHTSNSKVWDYINQFTKFNGYYHQVLSTYKDKVYQMPINLETINMFYNINLKPYEVSHFLKQEIEKEQFKIDQPLNFEEKAITQIGRPLYQALIKGYTKKQWQTDPKELPTTIIDRLPFRYNYNESYYNSTWQGIPLQGYTQIFKSLLSNKRIQLFLNTDFFNICDLISKEKIIVYSGQIDQFFNYKFGKLSWRNLKFESEIIDVSDFQGTSVMNYAEETIPFTRIHEPKHLHLERNYTNEKTLIIREYPGSYENSEPFYPINNSTNNNLVLQYQDLLSQMNNVFISGRLGDYKYYDMHDTINAALSLYETKIKPKFTQNATS